MSAASYLLDARWRFTYVNAEAERLLGRSREELIDGVVWELFPATAGTVFERSYRGAVATGEPVAFEAYHPPPLDGWYEIRAWPGPDGLSVSFLEITERRHAQQAAEQANARLALLAATSRQMAETFEAEAAAARLAELVVRALGDESPARILARTDRAMANLQVGTTTATAARLEQSPDERERGVTRLRRSSAGHPPAMVVHPDGTVTPLPGLHTDLLLGVLPDVERRDAEVVVDRGSTVLLCTGGPVERRDQPLTEGLEMLQAVPEELAGPDGELDTLVDEVLARMLPPHPEDDVALIAVRLHRQDRPRPAEAGPQRVPPHVPAEPDLPA
ncbi:hypothetical protein NUM3379_24130 [Kineococcus sp. NUM-3379]